MRLILALVILVLIGCAGRDVPPDWQLNAHGALKNSITAYLVGNSKLADIEFARARAEITSTGRPDLLARIELVRCAAHVASLEFNDCVGFQKLVKDATDLEKAYAEYLAGRWTGLNTELLPAQHRDVVEAADGALGGIKDPLSRLVAAGLLFKIGRLAPNGITIATQTASDQGWRRPLLAWLNVAFLSAEELGEKDQALRIQRRINLVSEVTE